MEDIRIEIPNIATVTFCGEKKEKLDEIYDYATTEAKKCDGEILREVELNDGYLLEVLFPNEEKEAKWKASIL